MAPMGPAGAHARGGDVFGAPRKHVYIDIFIYIYIYTQCVLTYMDKPSGQQVSS